MKRWTVGALAALALAGCGKEPGKAAFTGTWTFTEENSITLASDSLQINVVCLPPKFRISEITKMSENTQVYDGKSLHTKSIYHPSPLGEIEHSMDDEPEAPQARTESKAMDENQAVAQRFWAQPLQGQSVPGGSIAGRDTLLYTAKWKRPDGEFSSQTWVDAKTGVMLKNIESIYSSQAQTMVRRSIKECTSIDYTKPADAAFAQP